MDKSEEGTRTANGEQQQPPPAMMVDMHQDRLMMMSSSVERKRPPAQTNDEQNELIGQPKRIKTDSDPLLPNITETFVNGSLHNFEKQNQTVYSWNGTNDNAAWKVDQHVPRCMMGCYL